MDFPKNTISLQLADYIALFNYRVKRVEPTEGIILTDDKAPIEWLTDWMVLDYVFENK
jgi:hypothetical protein